MNHPAAVRPMRTTSIIAMLLGVAALNTGNNALYLLLALTLGAFVASGAFSRHTLSRLRVRLVAPGEVFAGAPLGLRLEVTNLSPIELDLAPEEEEDEEDDEEDLDYDEEDEDEEEDEPPRGLPGQRSRGKPPVDPPRRRGAHAPSFPPGPSGSHSRSLGFGSGGIELLERVSRGNSNVGLGILQNCSQRHDGSRVGASPQSFSGGGSPAGAGRR